MLRFYLFSVVLCVFITVGVRDVGALNMDPIVTITETVPESMGYRVRGVITEDVTLSCFVENKPDELQVRWRRTTFDQSGKEVQTVSVSIDMDSQDVNKWSIEKPTTYTWRLRIKALEIEDEGNYTCFLQLNIDTTVQANRTVLATEPPTIIQAQTSTDMQAREGDTITLKCNATGRPTPNIFWKREGNAILPGGGVVKMEPSLEINGVEYHHRGRYLCEAINEVGETYRDLILSVQFSPKIEPNSERVGQKVGHPRTLACLVDANPQPSTAEGSSQLGWVKTSQRITTDNRVYTRTLEGAYGRITYELVFNEVQKDDFGTYSCKASNSIGPGEASIELYETDEVQLDKAMLSSARPQANIHQMALLTIVCLCSLFVTKL